MRSIQRVFGHNEKDYPCSSTLVNFAGSVRGRNYTRDIIHRNFNQLVDKEDYSKDNKKEVLRWLESVSGIVEETSK
jgi:hypothetical protein